MNKNKDISRIYEDILDAIEENIYDPDLVIGLKKRFGSDFDYLQKTFSYVADMGFYEYIRKRKLTRAALDILDTRSYGNNTYSKMGYKSRNSFENAFREYHGCSPRALLRDPSRANLFQKFSVVIQLQGGDPFFYRTEDKDAITLYGRSSVFPYSTSEQEVPQFFLSHYRNDSLSDHFSVARDTEDGDSFTFFLGTEETTENGTEIFTIPASTWLVFELTGRYPLVSRIFRRKLFTWFLPQLNSDVHLSSDIYVERYCGGDPSSDDFRQEVWLPVRKIVR